MGYYRAGDYRAGGYYRAGGLGSFLGGALRKVGTFGIPGISTAAAVVGGVMPRSPASIAAPIGITPIAGRPAIRQKEPGITGAVHRLAPGGSSGFLSGRRTMNPGNAKAARRAIRRITSVRRMLMSIERSMPHQPCHRQHAKSGRR